MTLTLAMAPTLTTALVSPNPNPNPNPNHDPLVTMIPIVALTASPQGDAAMVCLPLGVQNRSPALGLTLPLAVPLTGYSHDQGHGQG